MNIREIGQMIKANLPGVIRNTPYSAAVILIVGFILGAVLL